MHNVLKSSTDWKRVEKKFKEEKQHENRIECIEVNLYLCVGVYIILKYTETQRE